MGCAVTQVVEVLHYEPEGLIERKFPINPSGIEPAIQPLIKMSTRDMFWEASA
jgi:hypothetical protein